MFAHESWMNVFFKVFNFAALIALLGFIYRRYIYSGIVQGVNEEMQKEEGMQQQIVNLEHKSKALTKSSLDQEHETRILLSRAVQWQATFALEQERVKHERQVLCDAARSRKKQQIKALESERLMALVVPLSISKARNQLVTSFSEEERGREYIKMLLTTMKKSL